MDTDSVMLGMPESFTKDKTPDEIVSIADRIGSDVNESFSEWGMRAFNCPPDRTKFLSADREVVADAGLFLSKKRYILHVIDDEGESVDKLKIMGVELKRSSASDFLKEVLLAVVQAILDDASADHVEKMLKEYKEDMPNRDIREIAVPSSCKTLHKAVGMYEMTGTFKGLHITAKSALIYNLMKNPEDTEIYPGDKVYTLYTKTKDGSIAFPMDAEPPKWIREIPVNHEKMWEKVDKAIHNYLKAMGWDFKSKKEAKREELFGF